MSETTARMITDAVGNLVDQSYDESTGTYKADKSTGQAKHVADQTLHAGENQTYDRTQTMVSGTAVRLTATGAVKATAGALLGFYVNSTSGGTIVLWDNASAASGTQITGTITPAIGWHPLPAAFSNGVWAVIAVAAIDVTFVRV